MTCKFVLAGDIYRLTSFPTDLPDLRAKIRERSGDKITTDFALHLEEPDGSSKLLSDDHAFQVAAKQLKGQKTRALKVHVQTLEASPSSGSGLDSMAELEKQLQNMGSYSQDDFTYSAKIQQLEHQKEEVMKHFAHIPQAESTYVNQRAVNIGQKPPNDENQSDKVPVPSAFQPLTHLDEIPMTSSSIMTHSASVSKHQDNLISADFKRVKSDQPEGYSRTNVNKNSMDQAIAPSELELKDGKLQLDGNQQPQEDSSKPYDKPEACPFTPEQIEYINKMLESKVKLFESRILNQVEQALKNRVESAQVNLVSPTNTVQVSEGCLPAIQQTNEPEYTQRSEMQATPKIRLNSDAKNSSGAMSLSFSTYNGDKNNESNTRSQPFEDSHNNTSLMSSSKKVVRYICNGCKATPIIGTRYQCTTCQDFDYCRACYEKKNHPHKFDTFVENQSPSLSSTSSFQRNGIHKRSWIARKDGYGGSEKTQSRQQTAARNTQEAHSTSSKDTSSGFSKFRLTNQKKLYSAKLTKEPQNPLPTIKPGKPYNIVFTIQNNGERQWPSSCHFLCVAGCHEGNSEDVRAINPGESTEINLPLQAPNKIGQYSSSWRIAYSDEAGEKFIGPKLIFQIQVEGGKSQASEVAGKQLSIPEFLTITILEKKYPEDTLRKAKFLVEIFGGDLHQHLDFVSNCKSSVTVEEIVELYLKGETTSVM